jgi:hypothetical protein
MLLFFILYIGLIILSGWWIIRLLNLAVTRATRKHDRFLERIPPISEAEFAALCRPGTDPDIALRVRRVLAESLAVDMERIYPSSRLLADLGAE